MLTMLQALCQAGLIQGLILALVAIGVMIPFKMINFPDLSAEGAYPLGGALCGSLCVAGFGIIALPLVVIAGGLLGLATAYVHLRYKVNTLLAGIILSTMIYSINLRLMQKPNIPLFDIPSLTMLADHFYLCLTLLVMINGLVVCLLYRFFISEKGLRLRAVGLNPVFAQRQGIAPSPYIYLSLFLGNALTALAGGLIVLIQQYADIGMGMGCVIHALAALMIGESLLGTHTLKRQLMAPLLGALIYQQIQGFAMCLGLAPSDLKLMTGAIVLLALALKLNKRQLA